MAQWHVARVAGLFALLLTLFAGGCNGASVPTPRPPTATFAPAATAVTRTAPPPAATAPRPTATALAAATRADVPSKAYDTLRYIQAHNGDPPPGYVGGTIFENREGRLPPGRYKEYDVDPKMPGGARNADRLVINQDSGQAYYTGDHYETFIPIMVGR